MFKVKIIEQKVIGWKYEEVIYR